MGMGPPGLGVLQTSGKAVVMPLLSLVMTDSLLTPTVFAMADLFGWSVWILHEAGGSVDVHGAGLDAVCTAGAGLGGGSADDHLAVAPQGDAGLAALEDDLVLG